MKTVALGNKSAIINRKNIQVVIKRLQRCRRIPYVLPGIIIIKGLSIPDIN